MWGTVFLGDITVCRLMYMLHVFPLRTHMYVWMYIHLDMCSRAPSTTQAPPPGPNIPPRHPSSFFFLSPFLALSVSPLAAHRSKCMAAALCEWMCVLLDLSVFIRVCVYVFKIYILGEQRRRERERGRQKDGDSLKQREETIREMGQLRRGRGGKGGRWGGVFLKRQVALTPSPT